MSEKTLRKIETRNNISINVFCDENKSNFPISISDQKLKNSIDFLLIVNEKLCLHQRF